MDNTNNRITIASARRAHELGLDAEYLAGKARAARATADALRRRAAAAFRYLDGRAPVDAAHHYTEREYCWLTAEYRRADVIAERTEEAAAMAELKASALQASIAAECDADNRDREAFNRAAAASLEPDFSRELVEYCRSL